MSMFLLLFYIWCSSGYTITDAHYEQPLCYFNHRTQNLSNQLGLATLTNNLLGDTLRVNLTLNALSSCALCAQNIDYCDLTLSPEALSLGRQAFKVLALDPTNHRVLGQSIMTDQSTLSLDDLIPEGEAACQHTLALLFVIRLELQLPDRSILSIMATLASPDNESWNLTCQPGDVFAQLGFDCQNAIPIQPIIYTLANCLLSTPDSSASSLEQKNTSNQSPLYWYHHSLSEAQGDVSHTHNNLTLCDEPLDVILYRSNLYLYTCYGYFNDSSFETLPTLKPWYRLANLLIAHWLNEEMVGSLEALDFLERHCAQRENEALSLYGERELVRLMAQFEPPGENESERRVLCLEIRGYFDSQYNQTLSRLIYTQWYYRVFKFILPVDKTMEVKAISLSVFLAFLPFFLLIVSLWLLYRWRMRRAVWTRFT